MGYSPGGHRESDMTERLHRENSPQKSENLQTRDSVTVFPNDGAKRSSSSTLEILIRQHCLSRTYQEPGTKHV